MNGTESYARGSCPEPIKSAKSPRFSFIMPVKDQRNLTRDCLLSLFAYNPDLADLAEILIVDDASGTETRVFLDTLPPPIRVLRNQENRGFAHSNNRAAHEARGEILLLVNNDLLFQRGWFESMHAVLQASPHDRIVGNIQYSKVHGRVDHAGKFLNEHGEPRHFGQFYPELFPWQPPVDFLECPTITAACWMLRRDTFLRLDGFDTRYRNGFEDDDLCMRARHQGIQTGVALRSHIYHQVSPSAGRKDCEDSNLQLFMRQWRTEAREWHQSQFLPLLNLLKTWSLHG